MGTLQNGDDSIEVVSSRSKLPDSNVAMMSPADILDPLGESPSNERSSRRLFHVGDLLSSDEELDLRQPSCGGWLLFRFITSFFLS